MARAQEETAQAMFKQALDLKDSGLVAGIDVLRAEVQLQTQRQRLIAAQNEFEKPKLQLARVIGLPIGQAFTLTDELPYAPVPEMTLDEALARAYRDAARLPGGAERLEAARATRRAANGRAAAVGAASTPTSATIGQTVGRRARHLRARRRRTRPDFPGRPHAGRLIEADAAADAARGGSGRLQGRDLLRGARGVARSAGRRRAAAGRADAGRELATDELTQARDRFAAGVASNIEVVQAQEAVAESRRA